MEGDKIRQYQKAIASLIQNLAQFSSTQGIIDTNKLFGKLLVMGFGAAHGAIGYSCSKKLFDPDAKVSKTVLCLVGDHHALMQAMSCMGLETVVGIVANSQWFAKNFESYVEWFVSKISTKAEPSLVALLNDASKTLYTAFCTQYSICSMEFWFSSVLTTSPLLTLFRSLLNRDSDDKKSFGLMALACTKGILPTLYHSGMLIYGLCELLTGTDKGLSALTALNSMLYIMMHWPKDVQKQAIGDNSAGNTKHNSATTDTDHSHPELFTEIDGQDVNCGG